MHGLRQASHAEMAEQAAADPMFKKVYESYQRFQVGVSEYHQVSEVEYYKNRNPQTQP